MPRIWILLITLLAPHIVRAAFVFEKVAETGSASSFQQVTNVSVGADGTVVFQGTLKTNVSGIYAYKGGQLTTIADTTQGYTKFGTIPAVNSHSDVTFVAQRSDGTTGVYRFSNGLIATIVNSSSGITPTLSSPSINDTGRVAFSTGSAIDVGDGSLTQTYFSGGGTPPTINNNGIVATGAANGAFQSDGTHVTQVLATTFGSFQGFVAMNNHNVVSATVSASVLTTDGTTTNTIATVPATKNGHTYQNFYDQAAPPVNDEGVVAFHPYSPFPGLSIPQTEELDLGSQWTRIIGTGDSLFGSTIATGNGSELSGGFGLQTTRSSFAGNYLAFRYQLSNGTQGIALTQVPEPSGVVLLLGLGSLIRPLRRQAVGSQLRH